MNETLKRLGKLAKAESAEALQMDVWMSKEHEDSFGLDLNGSQYISGSECAVEGTIRALRKGYDLCREHRSSFLKKLNEFNDELPGDLSEVLICIEATDPKEYVDMSHNFTLKKNTLNVNDTIKEEWISHCKKKGIDPWDTEVDDIYWDFADDPEEE